MASGGIGQARPRGTDCRAQQALRLLNLEGTERPQGGGAPHQVKMRPLPPPVFTKSLSAAVATALASLGCPFSLDWVTPTNPQHHARQAVLPCRRVQEALLCPASAPALCWCRAGSTGCWALAGSYLSLLRQVSSPTGRGSARFPGGQGGSRIKKVVCRYLSLDL